MSCDTDVALAEDEFAEAAGLPWLREHIERVARFASNTDGSAGLPGAYRVLYSARCGIGPLRAVVRESGQCLFKSDALFALAFAACVFPQRAHRLHDKAERMERFCARIHALRGDSVDWSSEDALAAVSASDAPLSEVRELLSDCCAVGAAGSPEEAARRRLGAVLHWLTCTDETQRIMLRFWSSQATLVDALRTRCPGPYSQYRDSLSSLNAPLCTELCHLEAIARRKVGLCIPQHRVDDAVDRFWWETWERLQCGFPYFAYRSTLRTWWYACLRWTDFHGDRPTRPCIREAGRHEPVTPEPKTIEYVEDLSLLREGYRVVRATFVRNTLAQGDPRDEQERFRQAIDDIWASRIQSLGEDVGRPAPSLREIAERHSAALGLDPKKHIEMLAHRLRLRIQAYCLARLSRLSNGAIIQYKAPRVRRNSNPYPYKGDSNKERTTCLAIATLARTAVSEDTLFYAFAVEMAMSRIHRRKDADPWDWRRLGDEYQVWRDDPFFAARERMDPLGACLQAPKSDEHKELRNRLLGGSGSGEDRRGAVEGLWEIARCLLCAACSDGASVRRPVLDQSFVKERYSPWFTPVVYLTWPRGMDADRLLDRLVPEPYEEPAVTALLGAIT